MIRIALNGFGRIGKTFLRVLLADKKAREMLSVVVINCGPSDLAVIAHDFQYDTTMGTYPAIVKQEKDTLIIGDYRIKLIAQPDSQKIDWSPYDIEWIIDASGKASKRAVAEKLIAGGAKKVLITAPMHDEDITIIPGINSTAYDHKKHNIISLGSCTTNALVPAISIINEAFGIEEASMTTTHAYTNTQALLDSNATIKDLRRSRAAALNIVPTSTGAMSIIDRIFPDLAGKISGCAIRVPVPVVSLLDLSFIARKKISVGGINNALKQAATTQLSSIIGIADVPLVSSDFKGSDRSISFDSAMTLATGRLGKVFGWYDNEWGYSCRLKDFLLHVVCSEK